MNRSIWVLGLAVAFALAACVVESGEPESQPAPEATTDVATDDTFEGMALELRTEANASYKDVPPPSTNASCGSFGGWVSNGSRWCGGTGLSCLLQGSVGIYTRESRKKLCCAPAVPCWYEYEYRDALVQCGC